MFTTSKCLYMSSDAEGKPINYIEGECLEEDIATLPNEHIYNGSKIMVMDTATLIMFNAKTSEWLPWRKS